MRNEAALAAGALLTLVAAVVTYLLGDGADPATVTDAVANVFTVLSPLAAGAIIRGAVYAKGTVDRTLSSAPELVETLVRTQGQATALEVIEGARKRLVEATPVAQMGAERTL